MQIAKLSLQAFSREESGTSSSKAARKKDMVPGIIYSKSNESIKCLVNLKDLLKAFETKVFFSRFVNLEFSKNKNILVLPKIVQKHPVSDKVLHIDFQEIVKGAAIKMKVPIKFVNAEICQAIKLGAILNVVSSEIELIGQAEKMPEHIEFDLKNAKIGTTVKPDDLSFPAGLKVKKSFEGKTLATVLPPTKQKTEEKTEAA